MPHFPSVLTLTFLLGLVSCTPLRVAPDPGKPSSTSSFPAGGDVAPTAEASRSYNFHDVESSIRAEIESEKLPSVAFAIARNGQIVHENAFGWADKERKVVSTASTPYPLASTTKPMVATALMMLHERGGVDLNAPALRFAGDWASHEEAEQTRSAYSLKQLLNHTSGLGTYAFIAWADQERPGRSLAESFRKYGFAAHSPGVVSEYSNLGYGLVGHIIARQSGTSLAEFLETELFEPLGMSNTMMVDSFSAPAIAAKKYDASGVLLADTYNDTPGAGNVYASAHDLALFGAFHLAGDADRSPPILSAQSKLLMRSFVEPGSSRYGLGWYFRTNANGDAVVWHEGGMPGASTIIVLLPKQNIAAAVVINANDVNAQAQTFANALIKVIAPAYQVVSFDSTDGFSKFSDQPEFLCTAQWRPACCHLRRNLASV